MNLTVNPSEQPLAASQKNGNMGSMQTLAARCTDDRIAGLSGLVQVQLMLTQKLFALAA